MGRRPPGHVTRLACTINLLNEELAYKKLTGNLKNLKSLFCFIKSLGYRNGC
jgi:hypothetical protein